MNRDGTLSGSALEQTTEVLSEDYDFDHDGMPETTELVTVLTPETDYYPAWYILQVIRQDGVELWSAGAHPSHAGWTSVFACKIDGEDYLLQYEPEMYQGWAEYAYELWAFDGNGQAYTSDNRSVTFDINFGREEHQFDPEAIAGFFWELRGLLQDSILLASTENGEFQTGIPGLELIYSAICCPWTAWRPWRPRSGSRRRSWALHSRTGGSTPACFHEFSNPAVRFAPAPAS